MNRFFDIALILLFAPPIALLLLLVTAAQALAMGRPLFFFQQRAGLGGRAFEIVKFRTMRTGDGPDADRLTAWGRFLRSTSLDELPEIWNVLKGDMSLVGPRPLPADYLSRYSPEQARRHEVRPGITGWAQVNGRNGLSWERQFQLDCWYVDHRSLGLDLKILGMTLLAVLKRSGIEEPGQATRREFFGSKSVDGETE